MRAAAVASALLLLVPPFAASQDLTLADLVAPSTVFVKDGQTVTFALHGLVNFRTLDELFAYIDGEAGRWSFPSAAARQEFGDRLLRRGVESRLVSMTYEKPVELLVTHTRRELEEAAAAQTARAAPFAGRSWRLDPAVYRQTLLDIQERWKTSLNCWSAAPAIPARVLSNWYPIEEGIELQGAVYDSTEHFWQAVKFHPDVHIADLVALLDEMTARDWKPWVERLAGDQDRYFAHAYAIEFLRANLVPEKLRWFREEMGRLPQQEGAREAQQRRGQKFRFTALQEKILWGDVADMLHLVWFFDRSGAARPRAAPLRRRLPRRAPPGLHQPGVPRPHARDLAGEVPADAALQGGDPVDPPDREARPLLERRRLSRHPHTGLRRLPQRDPRPGAGLRPKLIWPQSAKLARTLGYARRAGRLTRELKTLSRDPGVRGGLTRLATGH
jgi:hypothetical protein